ncbi:MAG: type II toxin-antitoxin system Phd/YefM family antitoxin [Desulfarculus sp.]|nr:type II toxin-antitoxin system Phd/YefM family antitoxin [Desulfarculus sp.]
MPSLSTMQARDRLSELVNQVAYGKERVTITRRGKPLAVLVPMEDAELIRAIEDKIDLDEARKALAEPGKNITLEQLKEELGF